MLREKDIMALERELERKGFEETDENEYLCTRKWEKTFEYKGKVYRGKGRMIYTIWDYSCEAIYIKDPYRYEGSVVMAVNGMFKVSFSLKLERPEGLEKIAKDFLDGIFIEQTI